MLKVIPVGLLLLGMQSLSLAQETLLSITSANGCNFNLGVPKTVIVVELLQFHSEKPCSTSRSEPNAYAYGLRLHVKAQDQVLTALSMENKNTVVSGELSMEQVTFAVYQEGSPLKPVYTLSKLDGVRGAQEVLSVADTTGFRILPRAGTRPTSGNAWLDAELAKWHGGDRVLAQYIAQPDRRISAFNSEWVAPVPAKISDDPKVRGRSARGG
jgi:hypothetical protein